MDKIEESPARPATANERGRPRTFDPDTALDRALEVFWRDGFQGASLSELTRAMGISKPSLYAAYGDKEALYLRALERYGAVAQERAAAVLDAQPDARQAIDAYLRESARSLVDPALPGGCFIVNGTADCGTAATPKGVDCALSRAMQATQARLRIRLVRAQEDGHFPRDRSADEMAAFYCTVLVGMAVLAKGGAGLGQLEAAVRVAMAAWPG